MDFLAAHPEVLVVATIVALSFVMSFLLYSRVKQQDASLERRLDTVVASFGRTTEAARIKQNLQEPKRNQVMEWLAGAIGYNYAEPYIYLTRWWVVCLGAIVPAWMISTLVFFLIGEDSVGALVGAFGNFSVTWVVRIAIWALVCHFVFRWMEDRYTNRLLVQFPDALGMIVRSVRVGIPVNVAIKAVADKSSPETAREFTRAAERLDLGDSVPESVAEMARHSRITEYRFFATALALQSQTGGGLTETLENLADVIRKRVAMKARGNALSSEAKTSAGILACLPVLTLGALFVVTPDYAAMLFTDPSGKRLLAIAVIMLMSGIGVMRWMIKNALR